MADRSVPAPSPDTSPRVCPNCGGTGGHIITTDDRGALRETWQPCGPCRGTGVQGGGI